MNGFNHIRTTRLLAAVSIATLVGCNPAAPSSGDTRSPTTSPGESESESETGGEDLPLCLGPDEAFFFEREPVQVGWRRSASQIIALFDEPPEVHVFDPLEPEPEVYELPKSPHAFSIAPDESELVVGHDGWVTVIEFSSGEQREVPVATNVESIGHGGNGTAYVSLPNHGVGALDLLSEELVAYPDDFNLPTQPFAAERHLDHDLIFMGGLHGMAALPLEPLQDLPILASSGVSGGASLWISEEGRAVYSGKHRFDPSDPTAEDEFEPTGEFSKVRGESEVIPAGAPTWADHGAALDEVATLYDRSMRVHQEYRLISWEAIELPEVESDGVCRPSWGRYIFTDSSGAAFWVVAKLGEEEDEWGVETEPDGPMVLIRM